MMNIKVKLKKLQPDVPDPVYGTDGSAGCDIHANEDVMILEGRRALVSTGICMQIPHGYECQIRPRSGLALRDGIRVFNSPSTIDSDYRGELKILLENTNVVREAFRPRKLSSFSVKRGMRIAQLVFMPVTKAEFETVESLDESLRGDGGWGSTGR